MKRLLDSLLSRWYVPRSSYVRSTALSLRWCERWFDMRRAVREFVPDDIWRKL